MTCAGYVGAQLLFVPPHLGLSWDETVYVSQVSAHAPAALFDPARSRGVSLLVAPVALLSSSIVVLRVYLAVASGLALFGSLLAWRGLRPATTLALAGLMFGGLWVAEFYGPQAMPDAWLAYAALAATGLFLRVVGADDPESGPRTLAQAPARTRARAEVGAEVAAPRPRQAHWPLWVLAAVIASAVLLRPGDSLFLTAALLIAALAVRSWRRRPVIAALVGGFAVGSAEWIIEAFARFGGPLHRLHLASAEQGGLGLHFGLWAELRAVNGPTLCRPCTVAWRYPVLSVWWLALPALVLLGVLAARKAGRLRSSMLAAGCAFALAAQYLFGVDYAAARFLLPAYALAAIGVADLLTWLFARARATGSPAITGLVVAGLLLQLATQQAVLSRQVADTQALHGEYSSAAADLRHLGLGPPCLVNGAQHIPIAFYADCASTPDPQGVRPPPLALSSPADRDDRFAVVERAHQRPPAYTRGWSVRSLPGTGRLNLVVYQPRG